MRAWLLLHSFDLLDLFPDQWKRRENMLTRHHARLRFTAIRKVVVESCLVVFIVLLLMAIPAKVQASTISNSEKPVMTITLGFGSTYKEGYWTPAYVTFNNDGPEFRGTLSLSTYMGSMRASLLNYASPWHFEQPVHLKKNTQQTVTVYIPFYLSNLPPRGVVAVLHDNHGQTIATQTTYGGYGVQPGNLFVGVLTDSGSEFGALDNVTLPNQTNAPTRVMLNTDTMPTTAAALANFDLIVVADFSSDSLSVAQINALRTWVNQGGILVEIGGPQWQRTVDKLPSDLVPVAINGTHTIPQGARMLPVSAPTNLPTASPNQRQAPTTIDQPIVASTAFLRTQDAFAASETILSYDMIPLIVKSPQGAGDIIYLAVDPTQPPLVQWGGTQALWRSLLFNAFGDQFLIPNSAPGYYNGPGQLLLRGGVFNMLVPQTLLGPWIIVCILLGYIVILGPGRLLIVKRLKNGKQWGWRIIGSSIVVFSLLSYGLASYQKGASLTENSISFVQLNQGGTSAHITNYMGIFVPNQGDYNVQLPGDTLAEPVPHSDLISSKLALPSSDLETTISYKTNSTNINLQNRGPWTFHPLVSEQDRQLHGGLIAHLTVGNNRIQGSIKNTLSSGFSDIYVLLSHSFVHIDHINAGETQHVSLPVQSTTPGEALSDQLAQAGGLPASYFPYAQNQFPQNTFQRHMAFLSALNGAGYSFYLCGGPCNSHAISSKETLYVTGGKVPNPQLADGLDPLLIDSQTATLIGWADDDLAGMNAVTINDRHPRGTHESFVQMPMNIDIATPTSIPTDTVKGKVVDIESYDAQVSLPGIYNMTNGGVTFEINVPEVPNIQMSNLTLHIPDMQANQIASYSSTSGTKSLKVLIYNWLNGSWDTITQQSAAYTIMNRAAYVDSGGRILVYLTPQNNNTNKVFFGKPYLTIV